MTPLQRRQFGKLVAASLTTTVVADLSSKALAQKSEPNKETLYAVNLLSTSNAQKPEDQTPEALNFLNRSNARNREDEAPSWELSTVELPTRKVLSENLQERSVRSAEIPSLAVLSKTNVPILPVGNPSPLPKSLQALLLPDSERATKMIALRDGTVVVSTVSTTRDGFSNQIISTGASGDISKPSAKKVLDLENSNQTIESLLSLPNNQILSLVGNYGIPPFTFRTLDLRTGKIISGNELNLPPLPSGHRFANLAQDQKGNIFATEISSEGVPFLISLNLQEKATLTGLVKIKRLATLNFQGRPLFNDVKDLGFSSSGQLYALAAVNSGDKDALFTVNVKTGKLELVKNFVAQKFVFSF